MAIGDQVYIWRAIGSGAAKLSGILAEGFIEELPSVRDDDSESLPFWLNGTSGPDSRVQVRLVRVELKHRFKRHWLDDDPIMNASTILIATTSGSRSNAQLVS
jgi:hypothetical protein